MAQVLKEDSWLNQQVDACLLGTRYLLLLTITLFKLSPYRSGLSIRLPGAAARRRPVKNYPNTAARARSQGIT
jgi:hypothetical protein